MTERFANFQDRIDARPDAESPEKPKGEPETPDPDAPGGEPDPDDTNQQEAAMPDDTPLAEREDYKAGVAAGAKAEKDRMAAVFGHENARGRETHAARLLGRSMSAEEIIAELPNFPAATALSEEEQRKAAEEGGRQEMREQLNTQNADLGADDNKDGKTGRAAADAVWDRANARVGRNSKKEG